MRKDSKILVIGHDSLPGSALLRRFKSNGYKEIFTIPVEDLIRQNIVEHFFKKNKPDYIFFMNIESGGIIANVTYPAKFIYDNLQAELNVIHFAYKAKVKKLLFIASSCAYPKNCPQPMKEEYILSGPLEYTSEAFAIAKIAGMKLCQYYNQQYGTNFICAIPATIYGPDDNFDLKTSHVIPALMRKIHTAKVNNQPSVNIWGSGKPRREFIHVDDIVDASVFIMQRPNTPQLLNIGSGSDISIHALANLLKDIINFKGQLNFDKTKPDGAVKKLLDITQLKSMGWVTKVELTAGLDNLYKWYVKHIAQESG